MGPRYGRGVQIVKYVRRNSSSPRVGVRNPGQGIVELSGVREISSLLRMRSTEFAEVVATGGRPIPDEDVLVLPPLDGLTEVWASGVTYERSRTARMEESGEADIYDRVYEAERPELFFKAPPWRVVTDGEPIGIRDDSGLDVPEPELGLVLDAYGEIVGYVVCNDVSSRSIEGENPLYLPQAKVYAGSCALSDGITPASRIPDPYALTISMTVRRGPSDGSDGGEVVWQGETSTSRLHRRFDELASYLYAAQPFPDGAVLATGTGLVPELDFTLRAGDRVDIEIENVGRLSNQVTVGKDDSGWLVQAAEDPWTREAVR